MKNILMLAASLTLLNLSGLSQTPSTREIQSLSNYFYNQGYHYLQAGHLTCDVLKVAVYFPTDANNSSDFMVGITYKDFLNQQFTCYYTLSYNNGYFTNLKWECHSPDVKCFKFCNGVLSDLIKAYQKEHENDDPDNTADHIQQEIARLFRVAIENLTCDEYVLGFLIIDYSGQN